MSRPQKRTVEYFPHYTNHKKTIFILENKWGNDGYAFWFKLLELLGSTEGHVYDCGNPDAWEFLLAYTHINEQMANEMLNKLAKLEAIDFELWKQRKVWSQNFVDHIRDVYSKRVVDCPNKPDFGCPKPQAKRQSGNGNPQTKLNKTKLNKTKLNITYFSRFYSAYPNKKSRQKAIETWKKLNPDNELFEIMMEALEKQKGWREQAKGKNKFIPEWPYPATWLNQHRWEDDLEPIQNRNIYDNL